MIRTPSDFYATEAFHNELILNARFITRLAVLSALASAVCGALSPLTPSPALYVIYAICCIIPVIFLILNIISQKLYLRKFDDMTVAETMDFLLAHREHADETAAKKLKLLKTQRGFCKAYAVTLGALGAAVGFLGGIIGLIGAIPSAVYSFYLLLSAFANIEFRASEAFYTDISSSITPMEYPELFSMARDAAGKLGCKKKVRIVLNPEYNMSVIQEKDFYCLFIGVPLLNHWNRDELYAALLHEFGHVMDENRADWAERNYVVRLSHGTPHFLGNLTAPIYRFFDAFYSVQFNLYSYASALKRESFSDCAMALYGDPQAAASVFIKLHCYNLFEWGKRSEDETPLYAPEEPNLDFDRERLDDFLSAIEKKGELWMSLIDRELLSRNASHPTTKMRLETLGVTEYELLPYKPEGRYADECRKATEFMNSIICERLCYDYRGKRQNNFLKYLSPIQKWESDGKPLNPVEYRDTVRNLRILGRKQEADELCIRAINELPHPANVYASFMHGLYLLRKLDPEGLRYAYHAIDYSTNYAPGGLPVIEEYCNIVGDREELEKCLEKAKLCVQKKNDVIKNIYNLAKKKEKLYPEDLPADLLEGIINYVKSIDEGKISRIYAAKKEIPGDVPHTIIVPIFKAGTEEEDIEKIMHLFHLYLDTATEWQFALRMYSEVAKAKIEDVKGSLIYKAE